MFFEEIKNILFPPICLSCGKPFKKDKSRMIDIICADCEEDVFFLKEPFCKICSSKAPLNVLGLCSFCQSDKKRYYRKIRSVFEYEGKIKKIIQNFKYKGELEGLKLFSKLLFLKFKEEFSDIDIIIPIPLHIKKMRIRKFNQSILLIRKWDKLKKKENLNFKINLKSLKKIQEKKDQVGLSFKERQKNIKESFFVFFEDEIKDMRILLIDDICTSSATINECSKTLMKCGALSVDALTLARSKVF